jgi:predicted esterase
MAMVEADLRDEATDNFIIHYAIEVPKQIDERDLGLFIGFHGRTGKAPQQIVHILGSLTRFGLEKNHVIVCPKSIDEGWEKADHEPVTKLIEWVKKTYPVNPRRIYSWGYSSGGAMSGSYALCHPELIACAVIGGSCAQIIPDVKNPARMMPDLYMICGSEDGYLPGIRSGYAKLIGKGYRSIFREVEGIGHTFERPPQKDDAALWATCHRNKTLPLNKHELALIKPTLKRGIPKDAASIAATIANLVLVGGHPGGAAIAPLLESRDPATRALAAEACGTAMFGPDSMAPLVRKMKDSSPEVRKAALSSLAKAANWRYTAAQDALCHIATSRKWDMEERLLAIDGIAFAVRLQVRGRYQDPPLFRALVTLLNDDDLEIRKRAFAVVQPIQESPYQPEAGKGQAALGSWHEWIARIEMEQDAQPVTVKAK